MRRFAVWVALVGSVIACAGTAIACWLQTAFVGWLTNVGVLAILLVVTVGYDRPGRRLLRSPFGWFYPLCGAAGAASVIRLADIRWPHVTSTAMGGVVVTMVVLAYVVAGLREPGRGETPPLVFPVSSGRWTVTTGGVAALNHHLASPAQLGGLDLVALRRDGARAAGVCPARLADYEAYGRQVVSPCDGAVLEAVAGEPDQSPQHPREGAASLGNRVSISREHDIVHLAHLRPGSLLVSAGDEVVAGQPLGEVGSSGRSSEPHLHIHAERDGRGVRLRFADVSQGRLRPGVTVDVAAARTGAPDGRG